MRDLQNEKRDHHYLPHSPPSEVEGVRIVVISFRNIAKKIKIDFLDSWLVFSRRVTYFIQSAEDPVKYRKIAKFFSPMQTHAVSACKRVKFDAKMTNQLKIKFLALRFLSIHIPCHIFIFSVRWPLTGRIVSQWPASTIMLRNIPLLTHFLRQRIFFFTHFFRLIWLG